MQTFLPRGRNDLDQLASADARSAAEVSEITKQARQRVREYRDSAVDLRRGCKAALIRYREVNGQVRDPFAPPPAYFATFPEFEVNLPDPTLLDAAIEATRRVARGKRCNDPGGPQATGGC